MPSDSSKQVQEFFWSDGSGFCFDLAPKDVTGGFENEVAGGPYDIPTLPKNSLLAGFNSWSNWTDKFQKDWRFGAMSDANASANLFPNVDDPWMFTEYVYEGVGTPENRSPSTPVAIVAPPLVQPLAVDRTYAGSVLSGSAFQFLNDTHTALVPAEPRYAFELEYQWRSKAADISSGQAVHHVYWESELDALGWIERINGSENGEFERTTLTRRVVRFQHPSHNSGVRLSRSTIWAKATRWGQSQNIPERVVNMSGPPDWFHAKEMFTNRIVPHLKVIKGQPIYDNVTNSNKQTAQGSICYYRVNLGAGNWHWDAKIGITYCTPAWSTETNVATYPVATDNNQAALIVLPKRPPYGEENSEPQYQWREMLYGGGELVHRGCGLWEGKAGRATCTYWRDHADGFVLQTQYQSLTSATFPLTIILTERVLDIQDAEVSVGASLDGPWLLPSTANLVATLQGDSQAGYTKIVVSATGAVPAGLTLRFRSLKKERPRPSNSRCAYYNDQATDKVIAYRQQCQADGIPSCPFYTPKGPRIVATFEGIASNGAEWANLQRGLPQTRGKTEQLRDTNGTPMTNPDGSPQMGVVERPYKKNPLETEHAKVLMDMAVVGVGLGLGGSVLTGLALKSIGDIGTPDAYNAGLPNQERTTTEVSYEPETVPIEGMQRYYDTADGLPPKTNPESALRLKRGTGYHLIEWKEEEAFPGVDTPFYGMVNQINYRVMHSIQHCYRADHCNKIILGSTPSQGWRRGRFAGVDFTASTLRMPGYPATNATADYCPYGDHRCPKTNLDRRAVEYHHNYQVLLDEILRPFRLLGIAAFATGTTPNAVALRQGFIVNGVLTFLAESDMTSHPTAMCVAVAPDDPGVSPILLGHYQPTINDAAGRAWRIFFFYDRPSWDSQHRLSRVAAHLVQFDDNGHACYMDASGYGDADRAILDTMYGDHDQIPWLVELQDAYCQPQGNLLFTTNPTFFAGGRNPEYRDLSKRGEQIVLDTAGYKDTTGREGATDSNQFGGPADNRAPMTGKSRRGYWIDCDGEFVLGEQTVAGTWPVPAQPPVGGTPFVSVEERIRNRPRIVNGAFPIRGTPSVTISSETAGNTPPSDYSRSGHVYSSDTAALLAWFQEPLSGVGPNGETKTRWWTMLPEDPNSTEDPPAKIQCSPPSATREMLPLERYYYKCHICQIEYPQEEINYFLANHAPLVAMPPAAPGQPSGGVCGCPRRDGGIITKQTGYVHTLETRAQGQIDIWAPPGTTVRTDGMFWKNPTLINRVHGDQFLRKLGNYKPVTGGYDFAGLVPDCDRMGRLPVLPFQSYNPGLSHQLTAPWASQNDTVAQVRARITEFYDLRSTDQPKLWTAATGVITTVAPAAEATLHLTAGDILVFVRRDEERATEMPVGMDIQVINGAAASIMQEALVAADTPRPVRSSYVSDGGGQRLFDAAIRQWLIGVVQGSLYTWSTSANIGRPANALARAMAVNHLDPNQAEGFDPTQATTPLPIDERILAPYSTQPGGGLKMITLPGLQQLRNRVIPMLAYDLTDPGYSAGGDYTPLAQASHENRFQTIPRPIPSKRWGTIEPQVMAANTTGWDYFVEWDKGDVLGEKARAYYPVGTTWWRLNQKVGMIRRHGGTNPLHLDDSSAAARATDAQGRPTAIIPYTGDIISSSVVFFLHGRIPMHMEVVKAYVVFQTEDGPSAAPLGCQGRYTGFTAPSSVGGPNWDNKVFTGHSACYFQHFHPWRQPFTHETDKGGTAPGGYGYSAPAARNHTLTYTQYNTRDEFGDPALTGENPPADLVPCGVTNEPGQYQSWMGDDPQVNYLTPVNILSCSFVDSSYGWDFTQPFLGAWNWGEDLQQTLTEHEIWKDMTFGTYDAIRDRLHTVVRAALDTHNTITFDYYAADYRNGVWPHEHQGVPGWINYTNYSTTDRFGKTIDIAEKQVDTAWANGQQLIVQAADGGNGAGNAGDILRVIDCTPTIKRLYRERVTRYYQCKLGWSLEDLKTKIPALTDTNLAQAKRLHTGFRDPQYFTNYRFVDAATKTLWLNDPWHHTPTLNDEPVAINLDGDPLNPTTTDQQSRISAVSSWDTQGLASTDANYRQYHPWSLCKASADFTPLSPLITPSPAVADGWRTVSDRADEQFFEMDLRSTPLELSRRPFRFQAPTVDSSGAHCPNVATCFVAQKGWSVAQFYERATTTWGMQTIPSTSSDKCANCHTTLVGVTYVQGDGITTVKYDTPFADNPLVARIDLNQAGDSPSFAKHGFRIEYYNTLAQAWKTLLAVDYDPTANHYSYPSWDGTQWTTVSSTILPPLQGVEGLGGVPRHPGSCGTAHFLVVGAAKLRFRVAQPVAQDQSYPPSGWLSGIPNANSTLTVPTLPGSLDLFTQRTITMHNPTTAMHRQLTIVEATASGTSTILRLDGPILGGETNFKIEWTEYRARCAKFQVYGWPYRQGDLTMTPPAITQPFVFGEGNTHFRLNSWATQVLAVTAGTADAGSLFLARATALTDSNFVWQVATQYHNDKPYLAVTGGRYYMDYQHNSIVLPDEYVDPTDGTRKSIWSLNDSLYNDVTKNFDLATRPCRLTVEYFTGIGAGVDVAIEAVGTGPSYQLDRECVCFIARHGTDNETIPAEIVSDPATVLPPMGDSERLPTNANNSCPLYWQVYNHDPIFWARSVGWLVGDELGPQATTDNAILDLFSGGNGPAMSNLGPNAVLGGKAAGTVTLYGMPGTILSGDLAVYAKAYTQRTYHPSGGPAVTTAERTGGYKSGACVFSLKINDDFPQGRKSVMASVPRLLVYLRERQADPAAEPDDPLS